MVTNSLNAKNRIRDYEKNSMPSATLPDQTLPLRELLSRYARGIPYSANVPQYDEVEDDEDLTAVDPRRLDLAERQEMKHEYEQELKEINTRINSRKKNEPSTEDAKAPSGRAKDLSEADQTPDGEPKNKTS